MADKPGSFKATPRVSRHTMVMRRAKDEDARRVAEREDGIVVHDAGASARLTARGAITQRIEQPGRLSERTASGRRVVVEHEGSVSGRYTRLSGDHATSVRVAGGDTIIRYQSGTMVIRRGAKRVSLRKQIIWLYALGYLLLFGCYMVFLLTGKTSLAPEAFIEQAFYMRHSSEVLDLERAALEAMRGNRTPAEIRMAQTLRFYDENHDTVHVEKGDRLTLLTAAKLGHAIIEDQQRPPDRREFREPFSIYREGYLSTVNWPYWMTFYNALGFFLLLGLFLWRPIMHYLGTQGKKTAVALRNARDAQQQAADYRDQYRALAGDIGDKGDKMRQHIAETVEADREAALQAADRQAHAIAAGVEAALRNERQQLTCRLSAQASAAACEKARRLLEIRLGQREHDIAIDELIADIASLKESVRA